MGGIYICVSSIECTSRYRSGVSRHDEETSSSPMTRRETMIRHSSSTRSNVVPLSVDKPVASTANIEWSVYAVCPEGFAASARGRGWLCISGTIVPAAPQIHITRVVVSQCPSASTLSRFLPLAAHPFVRMRASIWALCIEERLLPTDALYMQTTA